MEFIKLLFTNSQLQFKNLESPFIFWIVGLILLGLLAWSYLRISSLTAKKKWILFSLKGFALIILYLYFAHPVLEYTYEEVLPSESLVILDTSSSMGIRDMNNTERAKSILTEIEKFQKIPESKEHRFIYKTAHSSQSFPLDINQKEFQGYTDLAGSLDHSEENLSPDLLQGIILISDGVNSFGESLELYSSLSPVPIHTVSCGSLNNARDIQILKVHCPSKGYLESALKIKAVIKQEGFETTRIPVNLYRNGILTKSLTVSISELTRESEVEFEIVEKQAGEYLYKVSVPLQKEETLETNNHTEFYIPFVSSKIKILHLSSRPGYDFTMINRGMDRFEDFELTSILILEKIKKAILNGDKGISENLNTLFTDNYFSGYDLIILNNLHFSALTKSQMKSIENSVVKNGTGLIMTGGSAGFSEGGYYNSPLGNILPFELLPQRDYRNNTIRCIPSRKGLSHPVTRLSPTPRVTEFLYDDFPSVSGFHQIKSIKPLTSVLLEESKTKAPLLGIHRSGKGRVSALLFDSFYRFDLYMWGINRDNENWLKLLTQLIHFTRKQNQSGNMELTLQKMNYRVHEPVPLKVMVTDDSSQPDVNADIAGEIWYQSQWDSTQEKLIDFSIPLVNANIGLYETEFIPEKTGYYSLKVKNAGIQESPVVEKKFIVIIPPEEFSSSKMNVVLLKNVASKSGGEYYEFQNFRKALEKTRGKSRKETRKIQKSFSESSLFLLLFLIFITGEWILRKWYGVD